MTASMLYTKINALPPAMIKEVDTFVKFLKTKQKGKSKVKERKFGCAKGLMVMHDDFDAPLADFIEIKKDNSVKPGLTLDKELDKRYKSFLKDSRGKEWEDLKSELK